MCPLATARGVDAGMGSFRWSSRPVAASKASSARASRTRMSPPAATGVDGLSRTAEVQEAPVAETARIRAGLRVREYRQPGVEVREESGRQAGWRRATERICPSAGRRV